VRATPSYDHGSGHILVAVHEKNELEAIDPPTIGTFWRRNSPAVNCTNF
jgi:hypothetical protein